MTVLTVTLKKNTVPLHVRGAVEGGDIMADDECVKIFLSGSIETAENKYQEWFMSERKLIDRVLDRKINIITTPDDSSGKIDKRILLISYIITVFYILTD